MSSTTKVLAVIGESQHGKSSFINMISGTRDQAVGTGDGKSCTSELNPTKIRDHLRLYGNGETKINCDDLPGFGDTGMRMTNGQILESMKIRLAGLERRELDALLVFQSLAESRFELAKTFARLEEMFGPEISQSAIVILTKSDLVVPKDLKKKLPTIADILSPKNIPSVMWVNDSLDELVGETQKREQAASLRAVLAQVRPYEMMNMREYERRVEERARQLMAQDKSNTVTQTVTVPTKKQQAYTVYEVEEVERYVPKYSEEEVKALAQRQASRPENWNAEIVESTKTVAVDVFDVESGTETVETNSKFLWVFNVRGTTQVQTQKIVKRTEQKQVTTQEVQYSERDATVYEDDLRKEQRKEGVEIKREVTRFREIDATETAQVSMNKRDIDYYKKVASKKMAVENWQQGS